MKNQNSGKHIQNYELDGFSILISEISSDKVSGDINECGIVISCNEIYTYLEDLHNSMKQYFLNDQMRVIKPCTVKRSIKSTTWILMKQNEKFIDRISDSILQVTFKKFLLIEFWCSIKEQHPQLSKTPLCFPLHITKTGFSSYTLTKITYLKTECSRHENPDLFQ